MSNARTSVTVRYYECDMQRIVFNANYLAYADEAISQWFLRMGLDMAEFDVMVKRAEIVWAASSTHGDVIDLDCSVARWGTTSFDIAVAGSVAGQARFDLSLTYVSVIPGTHTTCPVPETVRTALA